CLADKAVPLRSFIVRDFPLRRHCSSAAMVVDACPWGLGGILLVDDKPVRFFYDVISKGDIEYLEVAPGDCRFQNVFELLAVLVAVRCWAELLDQEVKVCLWSDSVVALQSALRWRGKCERLNKLVLELAYDGAMDNRWLELDYRHLSGSENLCADALSRLSRGVQYQLSVAEVGESTLRKLDLICEFHLQCVCCAELANLGDVAIDGEVPPRESADM
ncbi:hypothetical protein FOL47_003935, partial [Perkinsus chesapeaki]